MPHTTNVPGEHCRTASAFILDISQTEPRLFMHLHKKYGTWMQVGGHVENDESPWQAICREISEESGYDMDQLQVLQPSTNFPRGTNMSVMPLPFAYNSHEVDTGHIHDDAAFGFITAQIPKGNTAAGESVSFDLINLDEIRSQPEDKIPANVRELGIYVLTQVLGSWKPVQSTSFNR